MKIKIQIFLSVLVLFFADGYTQINNMGQPTNVYTEAKPTFENRNFEQINTLNFNCNTVFWTIDGSGYIKQWDLTSGVISGGTTILQSENYFGISFCGNSFYCPGETTIKKYTDATGWTTITSPMVYGGNNGGYSYHQYFFSDSLTKLNYYDGTTFYVIEDLSNNPNFQYSLADIAVDSLGRAWVFCGLNAITTSLRVYDSNGLVAEYPFSFNTYFGYGSFFIDNVLYVGIGLNNPNANEIVPILFDGSVVSSGTPIPFAWNGYNDFASCNSGGNLNLITHTSSNDLIIYPNPVKNQITITTTENIKQVEIFDMLGRLIKIIYNQKLIDMSSLKLGTYMLKVTTENKIISKQIVKN